MQNLTRAIAMVATVWSGAAYCQAPVTLDQIVPIERQGVLGLDKLTPEQRTALVVLLQEIYQIGRHEGQKAAAASHSVPTAPAATSSVIESQIDGDFEGWDGETIVKLTNGQIWQQVDYHYEYHYAFMPEVLIYRSGSDYKMKVEGVDDAVAVKRLK